jgi:hypothetical protein
MDRGITMHIVGDKHLKLGRVWKVSDNVGNRLKDLPLNQKMDSDGKMCYIQL